MSRANRPIRVLFPTGMRMLTVPIYKVRMRKRLDDQRRNAAMQSAAAVANIINAMWQSAREQLPGEDQPEGPAPGYLQ